MCSPVKGSISNDNSTAVIQKQINPARMKNQWALRNSDNEKVSLPVRSSEEAPLTEQPSAFSCFLHTVQPFMLLSPTSIQGHSQLSKPVWSLQKKIILVDINGSQQTVFQNKEAQQSNSSSQKQLLVAHIISSDRETNESMRPQAWCMSWWRNWLLTCSEIKHLWKFFCKSKYLTQQWLQSLKMPTASCQTDMISLNTTK